MFGDYGAMLGNHVVDTSDCEAERVVVVASDISETESDVSCGSDIVDSNTCSRRIAQARRGRE